MDRVRSHVQGEITGTSPITLLTLYTQIINTSTNAQSVSISLTGSTIASPTVKAWYTDNTHDMSETTVTVGSDGNASASVPGRGMISFLITGATANGATVDAQ